MLSGFQADRDRLFLVLEQQREALDQIGRHLATLEVPQPPAHGEWQPVRYTSVAQTAAGYTELARITGGTRYVKLLAAFLTLDAAGTLELVQGVGQSTDPTITGTWNIATNGGFVLPMASTEYPWYACDAGAVLGLVSSVGKAQGLVAWTQSPALR